MIVHIIIIILIILLNYKKTQDQLISTENQNLFIQNIRKNIQDKLSEVDWDGDGIDGFNKIAFAIKIGKKYQPNIIYLVIDLNSNKFFEMQFFYKLNNTLIDFFDRQKTIFSDQEYSTLSKNDFASLFGFFT